jgi:hypothetical protein
METHPLQERPMERNPAASAERGEVDLTCRGAAGPIALV